MILSKQITVVQILYQWGGVGHLPSPSLLLIVILSESTGNLPIFSSVMVPFMLYLEN